jgi:hypothetical protein
MDRRSAAEIPRWTKNSCPAELGRRDHHTLSTHTRARHHAGASVAEPRQDTCVRIRRQRVSARGRHNLDAPRVGYLSAIDSADARMAMTHEVRVKGL